jgi:hypothetical protein
MATHNALRSWVVPIGLVCVAAAGQTGNPSSRDREVIAGFDRQVRAYVELHRRLEGPVPTVRVSTDPDEIHEAIAALARKIRAERPHSRQGEFFSRDAAPAFRRLIASGCGSDFRGLYAMANDENPYLKSWRPRVNGSYPEKIPYSMMPPQVLCALPELPEELQFRFWDRALILWDYHANLILDVLPDAIPQT